MKVMGLEFFAFSAGFRFAIDRYIVIFRGKANASDGTFSDLPWCSTIEKVKSV